MKAIERHKIVPTGLMANLRFRRDLLADCQESPNLRRHIDKVCRQDPIFFFNAFCWIYEPRPRFAGDVKLPMMMPFIAWPHQVPVIKEIYAHLGICDIGVEKSRGEGASWIGVLLAMHDWLFNPLTAIGLVSKDENSADDANDPDSLMWKCDFTLKKLPDWMSGVKGKDFYRNTTKHVLRNNRNGSTIVGYSCTADVGSGGRKKWFLKDELAKFPRPSDEESMASTQHVTESRLIVSTPKGNSGAYYNVMHEPSSMIRCALRWEDNPLRNEGLYKWVDGGPVALDPQNNPLPPHYDPPTHQVQQLIGRLRRRGFKIENRVRSPWYDKQCDRPRATPQNIAQELDRSYGGSAFQIFGEAFFEKANDSLQLPVHQGDIDFKEEDISDVRFDVMSDGPCKIWFPIDARGRPPVGHYVIGCDVASGTAGSYSSNSTIVVLDARTGEQALEYAINSIGPMRFADIAIAIARWFYDAALGWEHNGPGTAFTRQVLRRGYPTIYYRKSMSRRGNNISKEAGWWTDERSKEVLFQDWQRAVLANQFVIRSKDLKYEASQYVRKEGKITHALIQSAADDSKGASHGDRVIAAAVCMQVAKDRPVFMEDSTPDEQHAPPGTLAERELYWERQRHQDEDDWDDGIFAREHLYAG